MRVTWSHPDPRLTIFSFLIAGAPSGPTPLHREEQIFAFFLTNKYWTDIALIPMLAPWQYLDTAVVAAEWIKNPIFVELGKHRVRSGWWIWVMCGVLFRAYWEGASGLFAGSAIAVSMRLAMISLSAKSLQIPSECASGQWWGTSSDTVFSVGTHMVIQSWDYLESASVCCQTWSSSHRHGSSAIMEPLQMYLVVHFIHWWHILYPFGHPCPVRNEVAASHIHVFKHPLYTIPIT